MFLNCNMYLAILLIALLLLSIYIYKKTSKFAFVIYLIVLLVIGLVLFGVIQDRPQTRVVRMPNGPIFHLPGGAYVE